MAQRAVQILAFSQWPMRVHAAGCLAAEPFLPLRQKDVLQILVRFRQALCASLPQPFHQPVLQRCKTALYAPLGEKRVLQIVLMVAHKFSPSRIRSIH
jgi:hypothetical protein